MIEDEIRCREGICDIKRGDDGDDELKEVRVSYVVKIVDYNLSGFVFI